MLAMTELKLLLLAVVSLALFIQPAVSNLCVEKVYDLPPAFGQHHTYIQHIPPTDRYLLVQETGVIRLLKENPDFDTFDTDQELTLNFGLEAKVDLQAQIRSIVLHPSYISNYRVFIFYSCDKTNPACQMSNTDPDCDLYIDGALCCEPSCLGEDGYYSYISEFSLEWDNNWNASNEKVIMRLPFPDVFHSGGAMVFDAAGKLVIGIGDGSDAGDTRGFSQDMSNVRGKMLRIDVDNGAPYTIPADNPYVSNTDGIDERIYASGIRQPFRCSIQIIANRIFCGSVGQLSVESVYEIKPGENYGWGRFEGSYLFDSSKALAPGFTDATVTFPVLEWCRGTACDGLDMCYETTCEQRGSAVIGGVVYTGAKVPEFNGKYFAGDWRAEYADVYVADINTWEFYKMTWQQPDGSLPADSPTYQFSLARNGDLLMLNADGLYRMAALGDCGISDPFVQLNDTVSMGDVDIPYVKRSFKTPTEISSSGGLLDTNLTVAFYQFDEPGVLSYRTRAYNGDIPGPTLRIKAGDNVRIRLINELPLNNVYDEDTVLWNTMHNSETTNLHTHGLHVSSSGSQDNVFIEVDPQTSFQYEYDIHPEHASGMNYYHAHYHGSTTLQVDGGLYGALVVDPTPTPAIQPLLDLPEIIAVLAVVNLDPTNSDGLENVARLTETQISPLSFGEVEDLNYYSLVNGVFQPTVELPKGQLTNFRITNTAPLPFLLGFESGTPCTMHLIARDGIYLDAPRLITEILLGPANRIDVLIKCTGDGLFPLKSSDNDAYPEIVTPTMIQDVLFLEISGSATGVDAMTLTLPGRPSYLSDLTNSTAYLAENLLFSYGYQISDFNLQSPDDFSEVWLVNTTMQRTLTTTGFHPVHMHMNHFQLVGYELDNPGTNVDALFTIGEWRDTLPLMEGMTLHIKYFLDSYTGYSMTHCHTPSHADRGMSRLSLVVTEDALDENDQVLVHSTVINDYSHASNNLLGGAWYTDNTISEVAYLGGQQKIFLQSTFLNCYMYELFDNGLSRRESGIYVIAEISGDVSITGGFGTTLDSVTYRTPAKVFTGTQTVTMYFAFDDVVNPSGFVSNSINSFSLVFENLEAPRYVEISEIGYYRLLTFNRETANPNPTFAPTQAPTVFTVLAKDEYIYKDEVAYYDDFGTDGTFLHSFGSSIGSDRYLQLNVIDGVEGYVYFTFPGNLTDGRDGAFVVIKKSEGATFKVQLRRTNPSDLVKEMTLNSETFLEFEDDDYELHHIPSANTFESINILSVDGQTDDYIRVKEVGLFVYINPPTPEGNVIPQEVYIIPLAVVGGLLVVGFLAYLITKKTSVGKEGQRNNTRDSLIIDEAMT